MNGAGVDSVIQLINKKREDNSRIIIAIDGRCASGKTTFGFFLSHYFDCPVIHIDDFYVPLDKRDKNTLSIPSANIDKKRIIAEVLDPFVNGYDVMYSPYDCKSACFLPSCAIKNTQLLIVEGSYSCHPELSGYYDLKIFMDVDSKLQIERLQLREGEARTETFRNRWIPLEEMYFSEYDINNKSDICINGGAINMNKSKVYFTKEITPESLVRIYEAMGVKLSGKTAVKISTGEPGGHNYLKPSLIADLTKQLQGTIVECCTAYKGRRLNPDDHWKTIEEHGFSAIAPCDIMDEHEDMPLEVNGGFHLDVNYVGKNIEKYDSLLMLSHFKGHIMGGFGGALKNMSIGIASTRGKTYIHTKAVTTDYKVMFDNLPKQDEFLESMADACKSVIDYIGADNIVYINVANNLSVDCDCSDHPKDPEMGDIGIFASVDPVALDQACYDAIKNSPDEGKDSLIERMDSRHGIHIVEAAAQLSLGTREYELITID